MSKRKIIMGLLFLCVLSAGVAAYYLLWTKKGAESVARTVLSKHALKEDIHFVRAEGNFIRGMTFNNIELNNLKNFPEGTTLKIQKIFIDITGWGIEGLVIEVGNARLLLPKADPIVIQGVLKDELFDFNIYSKGLNIQSLLSYFQKGGGPPFKAAGSVEDIDLYIKGKYASLDVTGEFVLNQLSYQGLTLKDAKGAVALNIKDLNDDIRLFGDVSLKTGLIQSQRTLVKLDESAMRFSGPPQSPSFDLRGSSDIEKTKIKIVLKGTLDEPDLQLSTDPPLPREKIMLMLATGQSWKGVEESLDHKAISPNLTKDFVDYFIFAGKGSRFARQFGLSEISVSFDKESKGVSAKKNLTESVEVEYGINQQTKDASEQSQGSNANVDNKVFLKYQKSF